MEKISPIKARDVHINYGNQPKSGVVFSGLLSMTAISVVSFCIARRTKNLPHWRHIPVARWLILAVYFDSWIFTFLSTQLQMSFGLNSSNQACGAAILLCIACYISSKIIIYFFLVEKVYIIRSKHKSSRKKDKLYLFNTFGMLLPFCIVVVMALLFRVGELDKAGHCHIGLKLQGNLPLLIFDATINVYLTTLFLTPLIGLYSFEQANARLRSIAKRTFWGSAATLTSSIVNLSMIIAMKGREPGWVCLAMCNGDVVFSAIVLHWVTSVDSDEKNGATNCTFCKSFFSPSSPNNPTSAAKFSAIRSTANRLEFAGGARNNIDTVFTECVGGKFIDGADGKGDVNRDSSFQLGGISVRIDHTQDIENASDHEDGDIGGIGGGVLRRESSPVEGNTSTDRIHRSHGSI